jgi:hypothetical protein
MTAYVANIGLYVVIAITALFVAVGVFAVIDAISYRRETKRSWPTGCRPFMVLLLLCGAAYGQEPAKSICGMDKQSPGESVELIQVSCVDYEAMRKQLPSVSWPAGTSTQVLVHVREGDAVRVTVDGESKWVPLETDSWGRKVAMVSFSGVDHSAVLVKVYRELP